MLFEEYMDDAESLAAYSNELGRKAWALKAAYLDVTGF